MKQKAILFDLDGVLVDTEPLKGKAHSYTVAQFDGKVNVDENKLVMGQSHESVYKHFCQKASISVELSDYDKVYYKYYIDLINKELKLMPGVSKLLNKLSSIEIVLGIVSSSTRQIVDLILKSAAIDKHFRLIVSADDVSAQKPSPAPYLSALGKLSNISSCLVFEDTISGVMSALDAGLPVIGIKHEYNAHQDLSLANYVIESLDDTENVLNLIEDNLKLRYN